MRMKFRTPHPICKHVWTQSCECHNSRTALNTRCPRMPGSLATKTSSTPNNSSELKNCSTHLAMALQKAMFLCEKKKTMIYYIESLKYILQYDWAIFADEKWQGKAWKWFETKKQCFRSCALQEKKKKKKGSARLQNVCTMSLNNCFVSSWCMWCEVTEWRQQLKTTLDVRLMMWRGHAATTWTKMHKQALSPIKGVGVKTTE